MRRLSFLRAGVLALGFALLIADRGAAAAEPVPASPVRAALDEFDRVCGQVADRDSYLAAAAGAGWVAYEPSADSPIGQIIAMGQAMSHEAAAEIGIQDELRYENTAFRKSVNDRNLVLIVSFVELPRQQASTECRVLDATAPAPSDTEISAWTEAAPSSEVRDQGVTLFDWQPGFRPGFSRIAVIHVDPSSPVRTQIPVVGLGITSIQGPPSA